MNDPENHRPLYKLTLTARPGIAIRLLNASFQEIARSTESLQTQQPEGLYLVEWSSAGQRSQSMVRLDADHDGTEIAFDPSDRETGSALEPNASKKAALVDAVSTAITRSSESSIVVIVSMATNWAVDTQDLSISVFDRNDVMMRRTSEEAPFLEPSPQERVYRYEVKPGRHYVGFRSLLGEGLGQSVPVLAGRQTLVFLTVSKTNLLVANGEKFVEEMSTGVDPAKTVVITIRGDEENYRVRERVRLAGMLLHDLANRTNSLSNDVVSVLDDELTDPMLRLYGALVALSWFERRNVSPSGDMTLDDVATTPVQTWVRRIERWIGNPGQPGFPTDAVAACWKLARLEPAAFGGGIGAAWATRLDTPPLLECAWRWAIEESVIRPEAVRGTAVVTATARSSGGTSPWLCWRQSATKARSIPGSIPGNLTRTLPSLVSDVAKKTSWLVEVAKSRHRALGHLEALGPEVQTTALRSLQTLAGADRSAVDDITQMAVSLGLPLTQLRKRLARTSKALDAAVETLNAANDSAAISAKPLREPSEAPGLSRPILDKEDPQKGRFGGESRRDGFELWASFNDAASRNWTGIILGVTGPGHEGDEVQFHLHDSFKPPVAVRRFKGSAATMKVTAWGGFTVGVWIPAKAIELELDLASLDNAPDIVRLR
nr:pYEATS domain-containing protein [Agrobacterium pusense]